MQRIATMNGGELINGVYYARVMGRNLDNETWEAEEGVLVHQDNAPVHESSIVNAINYDCGF